VWTSRASGIAHIDRLSDTLRQRRHDQLAYFAFDLLHLDGHDPPIRAAARSRIARRCCTMSSAPPGSRVSWRSTTSPAADSSSLPRCISSEPKASSRSAPAARLAAAPGGDWLKTKVSEEGAFVITGFVEREAVAVAAMQDGVLVPPDW
jgi:hypothetical protein